MHKGEWVRSHSASVGPCKTCKGHGLIERHWVWNCPRLEWRDLAGRPLDTSKMLQRLDCFAGRGSAFAQTHMAFQGIIVWPAMVDTWQILGETDPTECPSACLVSTWRPDGRTPATYGDLPSSGALSRRPTCRHWLKRSSSPCLPGARKPEQLGVVFQHSRRWPLWAGWIPQLRWDRLWRLSKASVDSPGDRLFGGPHLLQLMGEACSRAGEWKIYATAVLSFATLCRVGEISSLRRSNISKTGITFQGIKRDQRQVTRRLGPYAQAWASWLRRIAPGEAHVRAAVLEMGMAQLLQWSERCAARWHSWRKSRGHIPQVARVALATPLVVGKMAQHQSRAPVCVSPQRFRMPAGGEIALASR